LPLFALANTAILIPDNPAESLSSRNSLGIILGLIFGKFVGIFFVTFAAVKMKLGTLAEGLTMRHILGISLLGGIGFTMSIFIANLAFNNPEIVTASKISILAASFVSAILGLLILSLRGSSRTGRRQPRT
jgi:NhaA family Na+:H+ antiporter